MRVTYFQIFPFPRLNITQVGERTHNNEFIVQSKHKVGTATTSCLGMRVVPVLVFVLNFLVVP